MLIVELIVHFFYSFYGEFNVSYFFFEILFFKSKVFGWFRFRPFAAGWRTENHVRARMSHSSHRGEIGRWIHVWHVRFGHDLPPTQSRKVRLEHLRRRQRPAGPHWYGHRSGEIDRLVRPHWAEEPICRIRTGPGRGQEEVQDAFRHDHSSFGTPRWRYNTYKMGTKHMAPAPLVRG